MGNLCNISIKHLFKSYGELSVFQNLSLELPAGHRYCLMGASGSGKTTLLRLIMGLEAPDAGEISSASDMPVRFSVVFQEDRLCETFSPLENVCLTADRRFTRREIREELCRLLPEESVTRPVRTLSGGMKRRTAIVRAMLAVSDIVIMDEPFTGLDEVNRSLAASYIKDRLRGRLLIVTTHQEEDLQLLNAELLRITPPL